MSTILGPAVCLSPFVGSTAPFDTFDRITDWAKEAGFAGVSLPTWDARIFDLQQAADDQGYCDGLLTILAAKELTLVELSAERQGRLVAAHPAYDAALDRLAPPAVRGDRAARGHWAMEQLELVSRAALRLGVRHVTTLAGSLLGPYVVPGPSRPPGIVETAFGELGRRWRPILDLFDGAGVTLCIDPEAGQDVFDGASFERFIEATGRHPRLRLVYNPGKLFLQQVDYVAFAQLYAPWVSAFHVSDGELAPTGRQALRGGFDPVEHSPARPRSVGDGQVDLAAAFGALAAHGFGGWATLDWACTVRDPDEGARESAAMIGALLMKAQTAPAIASEADGPADESENRAALGLA